MYDSAAERDSGLRSRDVFAVTSWFEDTKNSDTMRRGAFDSATCLLEPGMMLEQECNVDSMVTVMPENILIKNNVNLEYYMLPDIRFTLSSSYHIPGVKVQDGAHEREVLIHKIPNARFAQVGRMLLRIFFPGLLENDTLGRQRNKNYVPAGFLEPFYDLAVGPAAKAVIPDQHLRVLPGIYASEEFRARLDDREEDHQNGPKPLQQSAKAIPGAFVRRWIDGIRGKVDGEPELDWARGFFFVMEGKDLKTDPISRHFAPEESAEDVTTIDPKDGRRQAISHLLRDFDVEELARGRLYLDIATTVWGFKPLDGTPWNSSPVSIFPNRNYHPEILSHFTEKPINECENWVLNGRGGYSMDENAHLGDFAGARLEVRDPGPNGTVYFQLYNTSKSLTYNVALSKKAKRTSPYRCAKDWAKERANYFIPLQEAFRTSAQVHSVSVQFESWVPYSSYGRVHLKIPVIKLMDWLFWLDNDVYWQVHEYASLVITIIWMTNALVNRPDDGGHWNEVRDSALVHGEVDGWVVPLRDLTMFNLSCMHFDSDLPRMSSQRTISLETILYLFSADRRLSLTMLVSKLQGRDSKSTDGNKANESKRITEDVWGLEDEEDVLSVAVRVVPAPRRGNRQQTVSYPKPDEAPNLFEGVELPVQEARVRYASEEYDPEQRETGPTLEQRLSTLLHQFPPQIIAKAPNMKGRDCSWCSLSPYDASFETFRNASMPDTIFSSWVDCGYNEDRWRTTINAYLPTLKEHDLLIGKRSNSLQGLHCLEVWRDEWPTLLNKFDAKARAEIIKQARNRIHLEWRWAPWFSSNKLWKSGLVGAKKLKGDQEGGPWIVFNPKFRKALRR
ncbi:hypothetical protein RHS02_06446, partial [Rhizoctonia solani]